VREVRTVRPIIAGEEILISYSRLGEETPARVRRAHLRELYHFTCCCFACQGTEGEEEREQMEQKREQERVEESLFFTDNHFELIY
jgi:hypothetical protein